MQFLMGFNDYYVSVRRNILMRSPLSFIDTAFNLVSQKESHRSLLSGSDKSLSVFTTKKQFKSKAKNLNLKCSHCGGQLHLVERCF